MGRRAIGPPRMLAITSPSVGLPRSSISYLMRSFCVGGYILEIMHESFNLSYRTFDTLRSVHRSPVVENKRLDDMLSLVAQMQEGRDLQRSKRGPRRTGQTNSMFEIPDGSQSNGYQKRGRKPGRRTDFMNDPEVIARRQRALARMEAAE